jgi:hypothetical protein
MLDSLVRVSRRVGQVTDRFATDPEPTPGVPIAERPRSAGTDDSPRSEVLALLPTLTERRQI